MALEEFLEKGEVVRWRQGVETEAGPRFGRAFNDKRARASAGSVAISPDPAAIRVNEGIRERFEHLIRPQPQVFVAPRAHIGLEPSAFKSHPAVHAVAGDDEIRRR